MGSSRTTQGIAARIRSLAATSAGLPCITAGYIQAVLSERASTGRVVFPTTSPAALRATGLIGFPPTGLDPRERGRRSAPPPPGGSSRPSRVSSGCTAVPGGSHGSAGLAPAPPPTPGESDRSSRVPSGCTAVRAGSHGSAGLAPAPPPPPGGSSRSWAFTRCPAISCETADLPRVSPKGRPQSPPPLPAERQQTPGPR